MGRTAAVVMLTRGEGEAPAEPEFGPVFRLGRSLALPEYG